MNNITTTQYDLHITLTAPLLGTQPPKDVATKYLTSQVLDAARLPSNVVEVGDDTVAAADELETLPELLERGTTAFHTLDGRPILYNYHVKGFLKEAGSVFNGLRGVKNLRSKIDSLVFVTPRRIELYHDQPMGILERPLRAMTAQGPRTALARSEMLPEGTRFDCLLEVYDGPISHLLLTDLLSYGEKKGLGQWRNSSVYGTFSFVLVKR